MKKKKKSNNSSNNSSNNNSKSLRTIIKVKLNFKSVLYETALTHYISQNISLPSHKKKRKRKTHLLQHSAVDAMC